MGSEVQMVRSCDKDMLGFLSGGVERLPMDRSRRDRDRLNNYWG